MCAPILRSARIYRTFDQQEGPTVTSVPKGLLDGRVLLLSGVGPGLGRHVAENACAAGAAVMMGARSADLGEHLAGELRARYGPIAAFHRADVTSDDDCVSLVSAAEELFGGVDCIVANAAAMSRGMTIEDAEIDEWRAAFEVNLFGSLRLVKAAVPALKRREAGSVVFVGSQIVRRVFPGRGPYAASKAALLTAAQVLARELGPYNIRVNTVVPGRMWGEPLQRGLPLLAEERRITVDQQLERMLDDVSLPDLATDEECARAVVFLASDMSAAMTGQSIDTNAGETFH
jgi:NAD(P)-dependent dehydrogenase (short-subunit alcohol dehydrogenase family)